MKDSPQHSVSVAGAVVDDTGRVLVVRRRDNAHWEPPGGVLELAESIHGGLMREVAEETGLLVVPEVLTGVYKNLPRGIVALVFRCHLTGGHLGPSAETSEFAWVAPDDIDDLVDPVYAIRLRDALAYDGAPAVRTHDGTRVTG